MKSLLVAVTRSLVLTVLICLFAVAPVNSDGYDAFGDVKESKTVFDLHVNTPRSAWVYQDLIPQMYRDEWVRAVSGKPEFVIVSIGPTVRLVPSKTETFHRDKMTGS